jgi:thiol-disulfide isomerase/thioredoxin
MVQAKNNQTRRPGLYFIAFLLQMAFASAISAEIVPYSQRDFQAALREGKGFIVFVHAKWCPTCKKQEQVYNELIAEKAIDNRLIFRVDFDTEMEFLKDYSVVKQSTWIFFKDGKEVKRMIGETNKKKIRALFEEVK